MSALLRALVFGYAAQNRLRSAITIFAVALGVAIALAIDLANNTAIASFSASVDIVSNHINLQVLGIGNGFNERTLLRIEAIDGVEYAGPIIEDSLIVGAKRGDPLSGEILHVLGVDVLHPPPGGGGASGASIGAPDPDVMLNRHGALVSSRVLAAHHLRVGEMLDALSGDRMVHLRIAAAFPEKKVGVDSSVVFVDIATAQEIFGKLGRLDRIDIIADPAHLSAVQARVRAVLPPGVRVIEPRVRTSEIRRMLRSFQMNLAALSYVALLVGAYLIYNTVAISVVQRRAEIGTVRALGATRANVFTVFLAEGALFGAIGSLAGCGLGALLAQFSVRAVTKTVDALYVATHADRVLYDPIIFIKAAAIGVALAIVSAAVPAREAARTAPAFSMRSAGIESRARGIVPLLAGLGAAALVLAYLATRLPAVDDVPVFGYLAGLLIVAGASLLTPIVLEGVASLVHRLAAGGAVVVQLAATNARRSLFRTSVAVASLAVAVAMMVAVAILIGSFRTTVVAWANDTIQADIFVQPPGLQDASYDARFSPNVVAALRAVPGVAAVDAFRGISLPFRGRIVSVGASDFRELETRRKLRLVGAYDLHRLAAALPGSMNVLVSEPFTTRFGVGVGDRLALQTPSGVKTFTIAAVYNDYANDSGALLIDQRTFRRLFHDDSVNAIAVYAKPGVDLAALRTRLIRSVAPLQIDTQTSRELRDFVLTIFNRTFAITYALYIISMTIAVLGVVSTLFALVLERRRETGILRYLGLTAGGVRRMVYVEATLVGALGGLIGIVAGVLLSLLLIFVINRQAFGWLIELHMPYDFLVQAFVLVVTAALIAGVFPAGVAARMKTAEAVRTE